MRQAELFPRAYDGWRLYGRVWEPDEAPRAVVCLVHGIGEHSGRYGDMAETLTNAGYALFGFDLRGHGRSAGPRGHAPSYAALLDDIALLLEQAAERYPDRPRFIYSHSLGGNLALNYLLRRHPPLAGLIATGPALRVAVPPPAWKLALARACYRVWPTCTFNNGVAPADCTRDTEVFLRNQHDPLGHTRASARLGLDVLDRGEWAFARAEKIDVPLLIMQGSEDRVIPIEMNREFAQRVPGDCTFKLWDGLLHELHSEVDRREVFAYVVRWLEHCPANIGV